ncbi:MAG: methionyl-tRNA formyltransferase [Dehalococcoidia bacterium]
MQYKKRSGKIIIKLLELMSIDQRKSEAAMQIVFMGTPQFSLPALEKLVNSEHNLMAVYTQQDKASGRGRKRTPGPVKELAVKHGVDVFQPERLDDPNEIERLRSIKPDLIAVAAFGQILPPAVLEIPPFGCLNIHPSLLPRYRGASPVASAILSGDEETGVTIMLMEPGLDTGPILAQSNLPIEKTDTTESLEIKLAESGADLFMTVLPEWFEHKLEPKRQDNREATYTRRISKWDGKLDWDLPAETLSRRIRAYYPWPGGFTMWKGKVLKILGAMPLPVDRNIEPGRVVVPGHRTGFPVAVECGKGVLGLSSVQLEGKKPMSATEFLRGQRGFIGDKLG